MINEERAIIFSFSLFYMKIVKYKVRLLFMIFLAMPYCVYSALGWQQLTIESIDSLYGSGDRINYCHKARQRR